MSPPNRQRQRSANPGGPSPIAFLPSTRSRPIMHRNQMAPPVVNSSAPQPVNTHYGAINNLSNDWTGDSIEGHSKNAFSSLTSGLSAGLGERAGALAAGIPQPGDSKGQGNALKEFNDAAYPNTAPWEQTGSSSGAAHAAAKTAERAQKSNQSNQKQLQKNELKNRLQVATIQAQAQLAASGNAPRTPNSPADAHAGLSDSRAQHTATLNQQANVILNFLPQQQRAQIDAKKFANQYMSAYTVLNENGFDAFNILGYVGGAAAAGKGFNIVKSLTAAINKGKTAVQKYLAQLRKKYPPSTMPAP